MSKQFKAIIVGFTNAFEPITTPKAKALEAYQSE